MVTRVSPPEDTPSCKILLPEDLALLCPSLSISSIEHLLRDEGQFKMFAIILSEYVIAYTVTPLGLGGHTELLMTTLCRDPRVHTLARKAGESGAEHRVCGIGRSREPRKSAFVSLTEESSRGIAVESVHLDPSAL